MGERGRGTNHPGDEADTGFLALPPFLTSLTLFLSIRFSSTVLLTSYFVLAHETCAFRSKKSDLL